MPRDFWWVWVELLFRHSIALRQLSQWEIEMLSPMPRPRPMGKASSSLSSFAGPCLPSGLRSKTTSWTSLWSQGCVGPLQSPWMNEKSIPEEIFPFYWRASTLMATTYSTAFYIPWFETKQCNKEIMFRIVGFYFHFFSVVPQHHFVITIDVILKLI